MKKFTLILVLLLSAFILDAQNIGVGLTSPTYPLTVQGNVATGKAITAKNGPVEVGFYNDSSYAFIQTWTPHDLYFATNNGAARLMLANSNGYVGINTSVPSAQLDINGTLRIRGNNAAAGAVLTSDASGNATWQVPGSGTSNIYSIGSSDFKATNSANTVSVAIGGGGAYYTTANSGNLIAPVHLPNGAKVTFIAVTFLDNSTTANISFTLLGEYLAESGFISFATSNSGSTVASNNYFTNTLSTPASSPFVTINNATFGYLISCSAPWPGNATLQVKGVQIGYTF